MIKMPRFKYAVSLLVLALMATVGVKIARSQSGFTFTTLASDPFFSVGKRPLYSARWVNDLINWPNHTGGDYLYESSNLEASVKYAFEDWGQAQNIQQTWSNYPNQWMEFKIDSMAVTYTFVREYLRYGLWQSPYDGTCSGSCPSAYVLTIYTSDAVNYYFQLQSRSDGYKGQSYFWETAYPITFHAGDVFRFGALDNYSTNGHLYIWQNGTLIYTADLNKDANGDLTGGGPGIELAAHNETQGGSAHSTDVQVSNFNAGSFTQP